MPYVVNIYNQHAATPHSAYGRSRRQAFDRALRVAGEPWLRTGGDKLTVLRTLFAENLMCAFYRTSRRAYASHPCGAGVEFIRYDKD